MTSNPQVHQGGEAQRVLLVVAIRTDNEQIKRRMETILAAASTYEVPPDTEASVFAKPVGELTANDADHLAHFIGRDGFARLNVGDVVGAKADCAYCGAPAGYPAAGLCPNHPMDEDAANGRELAELDAIRGEHKP